MSPAVKCSILAARTAPVVTALSVAVLVAPAFAVCAGDCNADRTVTIDELVRAVNIAREQASLAGCPSLDADRSRAVEVDELIRSVAAALEGCPRIEPIFPSDYRSTYALVRDCRFSNEHDGTSIRVFVNADSASAYLRHEDPLPLGTVVVKEEFDDDRCNEDRLLARWRVMRKEEPGFDPEDGDWHWQWVDADRSVRFDDETTCIGCHTRAACLERDRMCTEGIAPPRIVLQRLAGALLSIAGTSESDVYAVGADAGSGPQVLHYDGQRWTRLATGASGDLWWISVEPIGGSFYMSGDGGLILQYDLEERSFRRHITPGDEILYGIHGVAPDDLWAVGGDLSDEDHGGVVWHFDGKRWTVADLGAARPQGIPTLFKVWARSADEVYAVGRLGVVLRYDGERWSQVTSNTSRPLFTVHGNASDVIATGGFVDGVILELEGADFQNRAAAGTPQLNGIFAPAAGPPIAVGVQNLLGAGPAIAFRGFSGWQVIESTVNTRAEFHAVWIDPQGGIWAVGGDLVDLVQGTVVYAGRATISSEIASESAGTIRRFVLDGAAPANRR